MRVRAAAAADARAGGAAAAGAVLNASGYVTARRQATVSSKITGKVVECWWRRGWRSGRGRCSPISTTPPSRKQLALAEAQLASQRRSLAETEVRLGRRSSTRSGCGGCAKEGVSTQADLDAADAEVDSLAARLDRRRAQDIQVAERRSPCAARTSTTP